MEHTALGVVAAYGVFGLLTHERTTRDANAPRTVGGVAAIDDERLTRSAAVVLGRLTLAGERTTGYRKVG